MKHPHDILKGHSHSKVKVRRDPFSTKMRPHDAWHKTGAATRWNLIQRILKSKIGQSWDAVHRYLQTLPYPARDFAWIAKHVELIDGVPYDRGYELYAELYVCPLTRTLQYWAGKPRQKWSPPAKKEPPKPSFVQVAGQSYYFCGGKWYRVALTPWRYNGRDYFYGFVAETRPYTEPVLVRDATVADKRTSRRLTRKFMD